MAVNVKTSRIDLRINEKDKKILERAARTNGLSLSSYLVSVCVKQAKLDLEENEILSLSKKDMDKILKMMKNPSKPNAALKGLMKK